MVHTKVMEQRSYSYPFAPTLPSLSRVAMVICHGPLGYKYLPWGHVSFTLNLNKLKGRGLKSLAKSSSFEIREDAFGPDSKEKGLG